MILDYFWLVAGISASFGALVTAVVLRKLDISRMSYREARQLLSAMVTSLSSRIERNEVLTKDLSEQLQILTANRGHLGEETGTRDRERLLEYMQDWIGNVRRFAERVDTLQKNLKNMEEQFQNLHARVEEPATTQEADQSDQSVRVGVVTERTLATLTRSERNALELLLSGPKPAPEIGRLMMRSREHTSRLMKSLFEQGFVQRETQREPYQYRLNDKVREAMDQSIRVEATPAR